jgi:hypothetical protein
LKQAYFAFDDAIDRIDGGGRPPQTRFFGRKWGQSGRKICAPTAQAKHTLDVKYAENRADRLEWEAGFAIDYAIASIEQAEVAVLDAIGTVVSKPSKPGKGNQISGVGSQTG